MLGGFFGMPRMTAETAGQPLDHWPASEQPVATLIRWGRTQPLESPHCSSLGVLHSRHVVGGDKIGPETIALQVEEAEQTQGVDDSCQVQDPCGTRATVAAKEGLHFPKDMEK